MVATSTMSVGIIDFAPGNLIFGVIPPQPELLNDLTTNQNFTGSVASLERHLASILRTCPVIDCVEQKIRVECCQISFMAVLPRHAPQKIHKRPRHDIYRSKDDGAR